MLSFQRLITINKQAETPVYLQIAHALIYHIRMGVLRRGIQLPASRELASLLGVNRNTVVAALDELQAQGWIVMKPRAGVFVADNLPEIKPQALSDNNTRYAAQTSFDLNTARMVPFPYIHKRGTSSYVLDDGLPDVRLAPMDALLREMRRLSNISAFSRHLSRGAAAGVQSLLDALTVYLNDTRGLHISPSQLMITRGAQMGIFLAAQLIIQPGDHVIVGEPGYHAANLTFQQAGGVLHPIPVDDQGLDVDAIEQLCKRIKVRLLYVVPHHHYPTSVMLSPERRMRLLELAAAYKFAVIEDDYDYDYHYLSSPVMPMASLDHSGSVIYIGTLNKTLAPAIRMGFMVAPSNLIDAAAGLRRVIDYQGDALMEGALATLFTDGAVTRHVNKVVRVYQERRDHFCSLLSSLDVSFKIPEGGMAVWTRFNNAPVAEVAAKAAKIGLHMSDGSLFNHNATRLGFASLDFEEQEAAIALLAKALS
jgi:GntR family transcriptional regulator / MocR family aminotransferase